MQRKIFTWLKRNGYSKLRYALVNEILKHVWKPCLPTLMIDLEEKGFRRRMDTFQVAVRRHPLQGDFLSWMFSGVEINKDTGLGGRERVRRLGTTTVLLFNVTFPHSSRRRRRRLSRDEIKLQSKISSSPPRFEITTLQKWNCRQLTDASVKPRSKRQRKQKQTNNPLTKREKEKLDCPTLRPHNQLINR